jgi:hypothetical protein
VTSSAPEPEVFPTGLAAPAFGFPPAASGATTDGSSATEAALPGESVDVAALVDTAPAYEGFTESAYKGTPAAEADGAWTVEGSADYEALGSASATEAWAFGGADGGWEAAAAAEGCDALPEPVYDGYTVQLTCRIGHLVPI